MDPISAIFVMTVLGGLFVKGVDVATDGWFSAEVGAGVRGAGSYAVRAERARWGRARAKAREIRQRTPKGQAVQEVLDLSGLFGRVLFGELRRFGSGARSGWRTARDQARSARTERRGDAPWPIVRAARSGAVRVREWSERRARSDAATPNDDPNDDPNGDPNDLWQDPPLIRDTIRPAHWKPVDDLCAIPPGQRCTWCHRLPRETVRDGLAVCADCAEEIDGMIAAGTWTGGGRRPWPDSDPDTCRWYAPGAGRCNRALDPGGGDGLCGHHRARRYGGPNGDPNAPERETDHLGPPRPKCPDCGMPLVIGSLSEHRTGRDRCHYADMDDPNGEEQTVTVYDVVLHPSLDTTGTRADIRIAQPDGGKRAWEFLDRPTPTEALDAAVRRIRTVHPLETGGPYRIQQSQPWVPPPWPFDREQMLAAIPPATPLYPDPNGDPNVPLPSTVPDANGDLKCGCCASWHAPLPAGEHCPSCHIHDGPNAPRDTIPNIPATRGPSMDINSAPAAIAAAEALRNRFEEPESLLASLSTDAISTLEGMGDFGTGDEADTAGRFQPVLDALGSAREAVDVYVAALHEEWDEHIAAAEGRTAGAHAPFQEV